MAAKNKLVIKAPNAVDNIRKSISRNAIAVGVHGDAGMHEDTKYISFIGPRRPDDKPKEAVTMAQVYWWQEFGTEPTEKHPGIPERPTLRPTMDKEKVKYVGIMAKITARAMEAGAEGRRYNMKQAMGKMGEVVQQDIQNAIVQLKDPPNAESTIARKKSDNPLIDSGQMLSSIRWAYVRPSTARGKKRST